MVSGELLGGRYRLSSLLGQGGTSQVWLAQDDVLGRDVAVKLLATHLLGEPDLVDRLRVEARAAARMHHPHVVAVYDFGELARPQGRRVPYVVMELVAGSSLAAVLRDGPLPWPRAVRIGAQIADALAAAHARGIVHRDVKPDNVMLLDGGGAKLVDFGISAVVGEADAGPDGALLGTPAYLAPERLDSGPVRAACDVYGLGLVLYESLTGELPWRWEGITELIAAHRRDAPRPLPDLPDLPAEVAELCRQCLAKRPADRPTAERVARVLAAAAAEAPVVAAAAAAVRERPADAGTPTARAMIGRIAAPTVASAGTRLVGTRRSRALALAAAGVVLGGLLIAANSVTRDGPPAEPAAGAGAAAGGDTVVCEVRYDVRRDSGGEFAAGLTVTNNGTAALEGWQLDFAFPADQRVMSSSDGDWRQTGRSVAVRGTGPDAALPAGGSTTLDFEGTYREGNPLPTAFQLNGTVCAELLTATVAEPEPQSRSGWAHQVRRDTGGGADQGRSDDDGPGNGNESNGNGNGNGNGNEGNRGRGGDDDDGDDDEDDD